MAQSNIWFYQVVRRNNDTDGKPYRLVMVYHYNTQEECYRVESCYETNTSQTSNLEHDLIREDILPIEQLHLQAREYNNLVKKYKARKLYSVEN
jgi:hypothetical protein